MYLTADERWAGKVSSPSSNDKIFQQRSLNTLRYSRLKSLCIEWVKTTVNNFFVSGPKYVLLSVCSLQCTFPIDDYLSCFTPKLFAVNSEVVQNLVPRMFMFWAPNFRGNGPKLLT